MRVTLEHWQTRNARDPEMPARTEFGHVWEERLAEWLAAHPAVTCVARYPDGRMGIDFRVTLRDRTLYIDSKSDLRRDTPNHAIQHDLPAKYAIRYPDAAIIAFDDFTAISAAAAALYRPRRGTAANRTHMILIPKNACWQLADFIDGNRK